MIEKSNIGNHGCFSDFDEIEVNYSNGEVTGKSNNIPAASSASELGWTDANVKLLINSYNEHKDKFTSPMWNKRRVWEIISKDLDAHNVQKNSIKCDEKWRNLKKTYDKIRNEKNQTGGCNSHWKFFDDFHEIYFHDPHFNPILTASSSGYVKRKNSEKMQKEIEDNSFKENEDNETEKNFSLGEKKRRTMSAYDIEQRKQKRHDERMAQKEKIFQWFKDYVKS